MEFYILLSDINYTKETGISTKVLITKYNKSRLYKVHNFKIVDHKNIHLKNLPQFVEDDSLIFTYDLPLELTILLNNFHPTEVEIIDFETHRTLLTMLSIYSGYGVYHFYDIFGLTLLPLNDFLTKNMPYSYGIIKSIKKVLVLTQKYGLPFGFSVQEIARKILMSNIDQLMEVGEIHQKEEDKIIETVGSKIFIRKNHDINVDDIYRDLFFVDRDYDVEYVDNIHLVDVKSSNTRILKILKQQLTFLEPVYKLIVENKTGFKSYKGFYSFAKFLGINILNLPLEYSVETDILPDLVRHRDMHGKLFLEYIASGNGIDIYPFGIIAIKNDIRKNPLAGVSETIYNKIVSGAFNYLSQVCDVHARLGDGFLVTNLRGQLPQNMFGFEVYNADIGIVRERSFLLLKEVNRQFRKKFVCEYGFISKNYIKIGKKYYIILPSYFNYCNFNYIMRKSGFIPRQIDYMLIRNL